MTNRAYPLEFSKFTRTPVFIVIPVAKQLACTGLDPLGSNYPGQLPLDQSSTIKAPHSFQLMPVPDEMFGGSRLRSCDRDDDLDRVSPNHSKSTRNQSLNPSGPVAYIFK